MSPCEQSLKLVTLKYCNRDDFLNNLNTFATMCGGGGGDWGGGGAWDAAVHLQWKRFVSD